MPRPGEAVEVDGLRLTADRVRGRRIAEVTVERIMDPEAVEAAEGMATAGRDNDG